MTKYFSYIDEIYMFIDHQLGILGILGTQKLKDPGRSHLLWQMVRAELPETHHALNDLGES